MGVEHADLAVLALVVGVCQLYHHFVSGNTVGEQIEAVWPEREVGHGLGGDRAGAGPSPRHHRSHRQELRCDRDPRGAGVRIERHDREGHRTLQPAGSGQGSPRAFW
jgi:hypothetical protein